MRPLRKAGAPVEHRRAAGSPRYSAAQASLRGRADTHALARRCPARGTRPLLHTAADARRAGEHRRASEPGQVSSAIPTRPARTAGCLEAAGKGASMPRSGHECDLAAQPVRPVGPLPVRQRPASAVAEQFPAPRRTPRLSLACVGGKCPIAVAPVEGRVSGAFQERGRRRDAAASPSRPAADAPAQATPHRPGDASKLGARPAGDRPAERWPRPGPVHGTAASRRAPGIPPIGPADAELTACRSPAARRLRGGGRVRRDPEPPGRAHTQHRVTRGPPPDHSR